MSAVDIAIPRLKVNEGYRQFVYKDPRGFDTIGYGTNLDAGLPEAAAAALLITEAQIIAATLGGYWWASGLDDARLSVVLEVAFNVGIAGLLHFPKMLAAIGAKDWQTAAHELLNSDAARELPKRYQALSVILLNGGT